MLNDKIKTVCAFLKNSGVDYEIFFHEPAYTIEECEKIEDKIGAEICKNLLLTTSTGNDIYLLMITGDKKFITKDVSKKLGTSRLSFASPELMKSLLNTDPGSLGVTSLIFDTGKMVKLAIDNDVLRHEYICCHPCDNSATLKIKKQDLTERLLPSLGASPVIIEI